VKYLGWRLNSVLRRLLWVDEPVVLVTHVVLEAWGAVWEIVGLLYVSQESLFGVSEQREMLPLDKHRFGKQHEVLICVLDLPKLHFAVKENCVVEVTNCSLNSQSISHLYHGTSFLCL